VVSLLAESGAADRACIAYLPRRDHPHPPPNNTSNTTSTMSRVLSMTCLTSEGQ
jgi:hypothetical protein